LVEREREGSQIWDRSGPAMEESPYTLRESIYTAYISIYKKHIQSSKARRVEEEE
jgi:hypothetical protein